MGILLVEGQGLLIRVKPRLERDKLADGPIDLREARRSSAELASVAPLVVVFVPH